MAEVFRAGMPGFGGFERSVAIKRMFRHLAEDQDFVTMLADEARIASQLSHPNIVSILDFGREGEDWFLAYELVDGVDLFRLLQRQFEIGRDLPVPLAIHIIAELASALDFAHARHDADGSPMHIVHRDVSPQNVLIGFQGEIKLTDFGIAKAAARGTQTAAGQLKGKIYYMSPEAARGEPVDHRSDLFAAGILLYELLCTKPMYEETDARRLLEAVSRAEVRWPADKMGRIPNALWAVAERTLARHPDSRYQSGRELREALLRVADEAHARADREQLGAWVRKAFQVSEDRPPVPVARTIAASVDHWASVVAPAPAPTEPERPRARAAGVALPRSTQSFANQAGAPRPATPHAPAAPSSFDDEDRTSLLDSAEILRRLGEPSAPADGEPPPLPTVAAASPWAEAEQPSPSEPPVLPTTASPVAVGPTLPLAGKTRPSAEIAAPPPARMRRPSLLRVAPQPAPGSDAMQSGPPTLPNPAVAAPALPAVPSLPAPAPPRMPTPLPAQSPARVLPPAAPAARAAELVPASESATRFVTAMEDDAPARDGPVGDGGHDARPLVANQGPAAMALDPDDQPASWALIGLTVGVWSAVLVLAAYATLLLVR